MSHKKCCSNPRVMANNSKYLCLSCSHVWDLSNGLDGFDIYEIRKCGCSKPMMCISDDGNRHQKCLHCGWRWDAPEESEDNKSKLKLDDSEQQVESIED